MNSLIFFTTFIFLTNLSCTNKQTSKDPTYFEGKVEYKFEVTPIGSRFDIPTLQRLAGSGNTLFFKEGNFLHISEDGIVEKDIYNKEENKFYFKKSGNDTLFWFNCAKSGEKILDFSFTAKKENILGIQCDELIIHYKSKIVTDYYNSDSLKINPHWLKDYFLDEENLIDEKEKAIYLKRKIQYPDFILTETATKISWEKVNTQSFTIPPGTILSEQK